MMKTSQKLMTVLRPVLVAISGVVGFVLVAAAFITSLQSSLAYGS